MLKILLFSPLLCAAFPGVAQGQAIAPANNEDALRNELAQSELAQSELAQDRLAQNEFAAEDAALAEALAPRPRVEIGFHTIAGAARYPRRAENEAGTASVYFSNQRSYPGSSGGALPSALPLAYASVTSRFGGRVHPVTGQYSRHSGVDLAAATGTPVNATMDGRVVYAGWQGNYGLLVVVDHGGGVQTRYAHLSALDVASGALVEQGDRLGRSGSTGRTTGPHLHYEVRTNGQAVDPLR